MEIATIAAAVIAAIAAIFSAYFSSRAAGLAAIVAARRTLLSSDFKDICRVLYSVVAYSVQAANASDDCAFDRKLLKAQEASKKLNEIRLDHRVTLSPLFDAIWHLKGMPIYVSHYRNRRDDPNLKAIIETGTSLREVIDRGLEIMFFEGRRPSYFFRVKLWLKCKQFQKQFRDGRPAEIDLE